MISCIAPFTHNDAAHTHTHVSVRDTETRRPICDGSPWIDIIDLGEGVENTGARGQVHSLLEGGALLSLSIKTTAI